MESFPPLGTQQRHLVNALIEAAHSIDAFIEEEVHHAMNKVEGPPPKVRKIMNRLYNVTVDFEIQSVKGFRVNAILDT